MLDADNKVLSVGALSFNPNMWALYKQIRDGEIEPENQENNTIVSVEKAEMQLEYLVLEKKHLPTLY